MAKQERLNQLSNSLIKALEASGIACESPLIVAYSDMDTDCTMRRRVLLLAETELIIGTDATETPVLERANDSCGSKWSYDSFDFISYSLSSVSEPRVDRLVVGGLLSLKIDGVDTPITAYTNGCNLRIKKLCDVISALNEGKELTDELLSSEIREEFCPKCGMIYPDRHRKICPKCMDKRSIFFRMFSYFLPHKWGLLGICVFCILNALINSAWPYLNGTLLYDGVLGKQTSFNPLILLAVLCITMVVAKLLQQLCGVLQGFIVAKIVPNVIKNVKDKVFDSVGRLSVSFFTDKQTGGLMTRIAEDANQISDIFIDGLPYILPNVLTIVFSCIVMFTTNWALALVAVLVLPPLLIISVKLDPIMWHYNSRQHQTSRNMRSRLNDNLTGARVVKAFGKEKDESGRFEKVNTAVLSANIDAAKFNTKFHILYLIAKETSVLFVWLLGAMFVLNVFPITMTYGTLITFVGYVSLLAGPIDFFSYIFRWWSSSMNSAQRIFEIMDAKPEVVESLTPVKDPQLDGSISINGVTFSYEANKEILKNISLEVPAGKMLGIVGKSGAGKSTLVNLISRLYDPQQGSISLSGYDLRDLSFADIRKNIAMVSQETYIFKGTIFENIAYADSAASERDVINAAIAAGAHNFICKLPDAYDTVVGTGGRSLSGGERQRISIARAILANPRILILDEATAAVDTETEKNIQAALSELIKGRTTISIAHRLSTLRDADFLVVFENGEITERGTHTQLVNQKGTYYKLLQIQSKALAMRGISE